MTNKIVEFTVLSIYHNTLVPKMKWDIFMYKTTQNFKHPFALLGKFVQS